MAGKRQEWLRGLLTSGKRVTGELLGHIEQASKMIQEGRKTANDAAHRDWMGWITSGPAQGTGRQHRFVRIPEGWAPSTVGRTRAALEKEDCESDAREDVWRRLVSGKLGNEHAPLGRQAEAGAQADAWGEHWGDGGQEIEEVAWPRTVGEEVKTITIEMMEQAARTFPDRTGLGWDGIRPKAPTRLLEGLKAKLVRVLNGAEEQGKWAELGQEVMVGLLAKPQGDFRPTNLFKMLNILWTRIRREEVRKWEQRNERPYVFAGKGKSSLNAAWMIAARAEMAAMESFAYAQALLDLAKAFDYVLHGCLLKGAVAVGYPIKVMRLSVAAYKAPRTIVIAGTVSRQAWPR